MIPDYAYQLVWQLIITVICLIHIQRLNAFSTNGGISCRTDIDFRKSFFFALFVAIFLGLRPISKEFPDMLNYASSYEYGVSDTVDKGEPIWIYIQEICKNFNVDTNIYFFILEFLSVFCKLYACRLIFKTDVLTGFLFCITAFNFWPSSVTIIRSGLGVSFALLGIALFCTKSVRNKIFALLLFIGAFFTHRSTILLFGSFFVARYFLKNFKTCATFYIICLLLSLSFGHYFENLFAGLGLDDRIHSFNPDTDFSGFSHSGFRWDFLLYSIIPIVIGWNVSKNRRFDAQTNLLLNTYVISNALWLLVIRALFTDRYASISWSIFPFALAGLLLDDCKNDNDLQKVKFGIIGQLSFIWLMYFYYEFFK